MTVGIGGWGSRRKPMALVREILRSDLEDLTIVSYAGPDVGLLLQSGKASKVVYAFATLDSIPLEPLFSRARQEATASFREWDEGMFQTGLRAAAQRVPFLPMRAGLGSAVLENDPDPARRSPAPTTTGELVAVPALELDVALVHMNRADQFGNAQYLGPDPYFDDLFCMAAKQAYVSTEQIIDTRRHDRRRRDPDDADQPHHGRRRRRDAQRGALHHVHADLRARREVPEGLRHGGEDPGGLGGLRGAVPSGSEQDYQDAVRCVRARSEATCIERRRDPRRVLRRRHRRLLRRRRRDHGQPDGPAAEPRRPAGQAHLQPAADDHRRRGADPPGRSPARRDAGRRRGLDAVPARARVSRRPTASGT